MRPGLYGNFDEECKARKGIFVIINKDNLCFSWALVVAIAKVQNDPEYSLVRMDKGKTDNKGSEVTSEGKGRDIRGWWWHPRVVKILRFP